MKLNDFSPLHLVVADWCVCQPDLLGFGINVYAKRATLTVSLEWDSDGPDRMMTAHHLTTPPRDAATADVQRGWLSELEEAAQGARKHLRAQAYYRRRTDPNRLPG